ncbi:MAG: ABC transporter permease [Bacillota bacterium]
MVINKKIRRTMLRNKSQYVGAVILIMLNCLLFTMFTQLAVNMTEMMTSFEKDYVQEDAQFVTTAPLEDIAALEDRFDALIEEGASFDAAPAPDKTLRVFRENAKVNLPAVLEGHAAGKGEILLDPAFAKANGLTAGSSVQIEGKIFIVSGTFALPSYIYPIKSDNDIIVDSAGFGIALMGRADFDALGRGNSFYAVKFNGASADKDALGARLREALQSRGVGIAQWTDTQDNKRVTIVTTKIDGISRMSTVLPPIILLLSCVLTGIVIRRLIGREAAVIGTLYALGYKRRELYAHYMRYPVWIALLGSAAGTVLGALLLKPMLDVMLSYFNLPVKGLRFDVLILAASLFLPLVFLAAGTYPVLRRELKRAPVELMRGAKRKGEISSLERALTLDKLKFPSKFKIRGQLRSLSRLAFLFVGVVFASMLLLLGFTAKSSIDYFLNGSIRDSFHFEYEYFYKALHSDALPSGTESFSAATFIRAGDGKDDFIISGIDPNTRFIVLKGPSGADMDTHKVIMTKPLAAKLDTEAGDTITVQNKVSGKNYSVTVDQIADSYIGEYIFMPLDAYNTLFGLPAGSYLGLWSREKLPLDETQLYSAKSVEESIQAFGTIVEPLQDAVGIISAMAFAIGMIVIYVVTSLIIEENRGNISLMKVFGYRRKEINRLILNSSTFIVIAGYLVGIPLILASMTQLYGSLTQDIDLTMPVTLDLPYILVGFVVVSLIFMLAKTVSGRKINRIAMSEALKPGME